LLDALLTERRRQRFLSGVDSASPEVCWPWRRAINSSGYGVLRIGSDGLRFTVMAHRAAWMIEHQRPIPAGQQVDHLCMVRVCCNPAHLRLVTPSENVRASTKHKAGSAAVVRTGPKTTRRRGESVMEIWREYLADGSVRQAGRTLSR
jgi:hypothetical protein